MLIFSTILYWYDDLSITNENELSYRKRINVIQVTLADDGDINILIIVG